MTPTPPHCPAGRRRWRWLFLYLALMLLAPAAFLYFFVATQPQQPIEYFLPDRLAAAARLSDLETVWIDHWRGRPGTSPEAALKDLYIAWGKWDRMVEKHGEMRAYAKARLMPAALFRALGKESWLLAGEWGGDQPGEGEAGLVLLIPGKSALNTSVHSIAELLLDDYTIQTTSTLGVPLYEFRSTTDRASLTVLRTGGWVIISNRRFGLGPLPVVVDRVKNQTAVASLDADREILGLASTSGPGIWATVHPRRFWDYFDLLNRQRARSPSKATRASVAAWQARLAGTERITIARSGNSLFDFNLVAQRSNIPPLPVGEPSNTIARPVSREFTMPATAGGWIALAEGNADFVRDAQSLLQFSTETLQTLQDPKLDLFLPGMRAYLDSLLRASGDTRVGAALYPSSIPILPRILAWQDRPPLAADLFSPEVHWAQIAADGRTQELDSARWFGPASPGAGNLDSDWPLHVAQNYSAPPPAGFVAIDFVPLARLLENFPTAFMDKKELKSFKKRQALARALAFGLGGATLRYDDSGEISTLRLRTPHNE